MNTDIGVRQMARELGCSAALVVKMRAAGMPMHSVDAARRWRAANVRVRVRPVPTGAELEQLRGRLAAMTDSELAEVRLPEATWDALTGWGPTQ